ncbi:MAG TPA: protease pro-enzyme activation domain-containing protein [Verrucomicrobiae bacterium]|nr:protease pro-enzyme activation domain-containing protein [Verrucomicrobiae bacterium]
MKHAILLIAVFGLCTLLQIDSTAATQAGMKILHGHLPNLPAGLKFHGEVPATNQLRLAIGLPLKNEPDLDDFLTQVYDPASPNYHKYLTPDQFTERYAPSVEDYQKVLEFARTNGLQVTATHRNRLLVDVQGQVDKIEHAFHIKMISYAHPSEGRDFYTPDTEPTVGVDIPIADISGLNNYTLPRPRLVRGSRSSQANLTLQTGSSPTGSYMGNDFRMAYVPDVALTGIGQEVGLLEFDGFYPADISAYKTQARLPDVPVSTVLVDGYNGVPTTGPNSGNTEVALDIEMAIAMAPGLSQVLVFEAGPSGIPNDVLNQMAASSQVKQLSCSWGWGGGPSATTDNIFKQMAVQGQSFFTASGDSDAFTTGSSSANGVDNPLLANAPSSSPYITVVGGTILVTAGPGGAWSSETVWNWGLHNGSYVGSSGGISSFYSIPSWQSGISMAANGGSTTQRNSPDVALTGDNVYVTADNGANQTVGGTSCAAPLWAAFTALANQQALSAGKSPVGFINPSIYSIGKGPEFASNFRDVTSGNNTSGNSPNEFYAATGYDLCTGWGTPAGQALINSISGVTNALEILFAAELTSSGPVGGPFSPDTQTFTLTNSGAAELAWSIANTSQWVNVSSTAGTLLADAVAGIGVSLATAANSLAPGIYNSALLVTNQNGGAITFPITLTVGQSILVNGGFETGDFTGWTLVGNTTFSGNIYNAVESASSGFSVIHSGTYGAFLGDIQLASLSQTFATVPGQYYLLSLWLDNPTSGTVQQFQLSWMTSGITNVLFSILNPASFSWTNLQFLVSAADIQSTLEIQAENDPAYFGLDDVRLTPIPLPRITGCERAGDSVQLSWITAAGLVYQAQYKTNLLQPDWINLGSSFVATSNSTVFQDSHTFLSSPRKFYRLIVSP